MDEITLDLQDVVYSHFDLNASHRVVQYCQLFHALAAPGNSQCNTIHLPLDSNHSLVGDYKEVSLL